MMFQWAKVCSGRFVSLHLRNTEPLIIAPSLADVRLELAEEEESRDGLTGSIAFLSEGFSIEKAQ
jgi:hypothetical protein